MSRSPGFRFVARLVLVCSAGCGIVPDLDVGPTLAVSNAIVDISVDVGNPTATRTVTIVNGTDGDLTGITASVEYTGVAGWLSTSLDRTSASSGQPATLTIQVAGGSLSLGSYEARIRLDADEAGNAPLFVHVPLTVTPRPPAKIAIFTQPSAQGASGTALAVQPVVQLLNGLDEPVPQAGVVISVAIGSGGGQLLGATSVATGTDGRAAFTGLGLLGLAGNRTLVFSADGLTSATSAVISLGGGAAARLEAVSATTLAADAGTPVSDPPRVRVVDAAGNPIAGFTVTFAASVGAVIVPAGDLPTAASGIAGLTAWTLNPVAGANTVTATAGGLEGSPITFTATGQVGAAATIAKQSGDNLVGLVGTALGTAHVVKVADGFGNGVAGVTVTWTAAGGGSVSPASNQTDAQGLASAVRTLGANVGPATTQASTSVGTVTFNVTGANTGPAQIVKVTGDNQTGAVATALPVALQVQVLDAVNTPQPNVTVTFTTTAAGGTFPGGAVVQTDVNGLAAVTWQLGTVAGAQSAQAAVGGPAPAVFAATATPGPVSAAASTVAADNPIQADSVSSITVIVRDGFGNPISGTTVTLSATGGAGVLTQPPGPTDGNGVATGSFTATLAGTRTISATADGTPVAQTAAINVQPGPPAAITALTATSFGVRFGQPVLPLPSVLVADAFGNGVAGVTVTFVSIQGDPAALTPAATATNASGIAAVTAWNVNVFDANPAGANVYNRVTATAAGGGIAGNPIVFTGTALVFHHTNGGGNTRDLYAYWQSSCASCHGGGQTPTLTGTAASVYTTLQSLITPGDSSLAANLLLRKLSALSATGHGGGKFANHIVTIIAAWIQQGAFQ